MFDQLPTGLSPRLVSLTTAVPPIDLPQEEVTRRAAELFGVNSSAYEWLAPIYINADIEQSPLLRAVRVVPAGPHSFGERNNLFLENATKLLTEAAQSALDQAGLAGR